LGFLGEIWPKKRQKFALIGHFCALIGHFCALFHVFCRRKIRETKFNKPILPLNRGIARPVFGFDFLPQRHQEKTISFKKLTADFTDKKLKKFAKDLHRFFSIIFLVLG
jgi:hypothetical protein